MTKLNLPQRVLDMIPSEPTPVVHMSQDDEGNYVLDSSDGVLNHKVYSSKIEAYDSIDQTVYDVSLDYLSESEGSLDFVKKNENDSFSRGLLSYTDTDRYWLLEHAYQDFLKACEKYENADRSMSVLQIIATTHPALWRREDSKNFWHIETEQDVSITPVLDEATGEVTWMVSNSIVSTNNETVEEGYAAIVAILMSLYDLAGNLKEPLRPEAELDLEEMMQEFARDLSKEVD